MIKKEVKKPNFNVIPIQWKIVCWHCKKSGKGITLTRLRFQGKKTDLYACQNCTVYDVPTIGASSKEPINYKMEVIKDEPK